MQHKGLELHAGFAQRFWIGYGIVWLVLIVLYGVFGQYRCVLCVCVTL
jgi:hypothetical protein